MSETEIESRLKKLKGWSYRDGFLVKNFRFKTFMQGIRFVNSVAQLAEEIQHHPDIHVRWTNVRLEIQSHDEGGVTSRDFNLAGKIEKMIGEKEKGKSSKTKIEKRL
ncbi:MAG: 4a-hydroxytetrahydrobiopterin dehydratase [Conexivisphaerales archaeon]